MLTSLFLLLIGAYLGIVFTKPLIARHQRILLLARLFHSVVYCSRTAPTPAELTVVQHMLGSIANELNIISPRQREATAKHLRQQVMDEFEWVSQQRRCWQRK